jgi:hypothetical protein
VDLIGWLDVMAQALETKRDPDQSILYEDAWALCFTGVVNAFFEPSSGFIKFRWAHFVGGDMERRTLSHPGVSYLSLDGLISWL